MRISRNSMGFFVVLVAIASTRAHAVEERRYVKWDATGSNDGRSWCNAYPELYVALGEPGVTEIWVARGMYKPGPPPAGGSQINRSFRITQPMKIFGGFDGTEALRPQRDPAANETILSCDLDNPPNDPPNGPPIGNNCYAVVRTRYAGLTPQDTWLDGFTITGGNNIGTGIEDGLEAGGGGIRFEYGSIRVERCVIKGNHAANGGGGIYLDGIFESFRPQIVNCVIRNNSAGHGGALAAKKSSVPYIVNTLITDNGSGGEGGALSFGGSDEQTDGWIINSVIAHNNSVSLAAGIYFDGAQAARLNIINSVIADNVSASASLHGGGMAVSGSAVASLDNSIVYGNSTANTLRAQQIANYSNAPVTVRCSDIQNRNPTIVDLVGTVTLDSASISLDPMFVNTAGPNYNYQLFPNSPCAEHGDTSLLPPDEADVDQDGNTTEALPLDFGGFKRVEDDLDTADPGDPPPTYCAFVDMGACETPTRDSYAFPPTSEPNGIPKSRYISFLPHAGYSAIRVDLTYLNHPYPTGVSATVLTAIEGQSRWVGPPEVVTHHGVSYVVAKLQCLPHIQEWSDSDVIHVYGTEIVPDSLYEVCTVIQNLCLAIGNGGIPRVSVPLQIRTSRWADVTTPQFLTSCGFGNQPNMLDISAIVNYWKEGPNTISYPRALLRNGVLFAIPGMPFVFDRAPDPHDSVTFQDISLAVNAFLEKPYPYNGLWECE